MPVTVLRHLVLNKLVNATHSLRLPFTPSQARLQLEESLAKFRQDKRFRALPSHVHVPVTNMDIRIGALDLGDPERLHAARELLRTFDFASSVGNPTSTPLSVTLRGLSSGYVSRRERTRFFNAPALEAPWLDRLSDDLALAFKINKIPYTSSKEPYFGSSFAHHVTLVNLRYFRIRTETPTSEPGARWRRKTEIPAFEAGDIYKEYADTVWVHNLPLDRICLSLKGLRDKMKNNEIIGSGYKHILSVPLPGASDTTLEPEDPEIIYVKSTARARALRTTMPHVITSETDPLEIKRPPPEIKRPSSGLVLAI